MQVEGVREPVELFDAGLYLVGVCVHARVRLPASVCACVFDIRYVCMYVCI